MLITREVSCEECQEGIQSSIDQLVSEDFVAGIVDAMSGDGFCGMEEDSELCAKTIAVLIPLALPALATQNDPQAAIDICNTAIPGTC